MGFYESILGSGNGIIFTAITCRTRGYEFLTALGYYFGIAFFWVAFTAVLCSQKGYYDLRIMSAAVIGSLLGGYLGAKLAYRKGNRFTKKVFMIVGLFLGIRLIAESAGFF